MRDCESQKPFDCIPSEAEFASTYGWVEAHPFQNEYRSIYVTHYTSYPAGEYEPRQVTERWGRLLWLSSVGIRTILSFLS